MDPKRIEWVGALRRHDALSVGQIKSYLHDNTTVNIANVMNGRHFVLLIGYDLSDPNLFYVHDPGFERIAYNYSEIVGYRLFRMVPYK